LRKLSTEIFDALNKKIEHFKNIRSILSTEYKFREELLKNIPTDQRETKMAMEIVKTEKSEKNQYSKKIWCL